MASKIEWCDDTWNPITGCSPISAGCDHCYAARMAKRLHGRAGYPDKNPFAVTLHMNRMNELIGWKKPRRIFVCSMGDLFHGKVPIEWINSVLGWMNEAPQHTYMILTKRPARLLTLYDSGSLPHWNPKIIQLGVTVESQENVCRAGFILYVPAACYFVSAEPCLGQIDFTPYMRPKNGQHIDGVILGGETGPGARPMHPAWVRSARDQCVANGIPFFFKSWGEWAPRAQVTSLTGKRWGTICEDGHWFESTTPWNGHDDDGNGEAVMVRVGKRNAGRLLDGREWNQLPGERIEECRISP